MAVFVVINVRGRRSRFVTMVPAVDSYSGYVGSAQTIPVYGITLNTLSEWWIITASLIYHSLDRSTPRMGTDPFSTQEAKPHQCYR